MAVSRMCETVLSLSVVSAGATATQPSVNRSHTYTQPTCIGLGGLDYLPDLRRSLASLRQ